MKILITGGLGFIGRTLVEYLIKKTDYQIHIVDIRFFPSELQSQRIFFHKFDICNKDELFMLCDREKFDGIVHLAAVSRVEDGQSDPQLCVKVNYQGTKNVCEACNKTSNTWIISASSREVYGEEEKKKFPVCEDNELLPVNVYGHTKLEGELLIQALCKNYCIMRFSNVYGNLYDRKERVIPVFVQQAVKGKTLVLQGGEQVIDFTYIDDTVRTIYKAIEYIQKKNNNQLIVHVTPGRENRLENIAKLIIQLTKSKSQIEKRPDEKREYDVVQFIGSPEKRFNLFGRDNFLTIEEGLKKYLNNLQVSAKHFLD